MGFTDWASQRADRAARLAPLWACVASLGLTATVAADAGNVRCTTTENGAPSQGSIVMTRASQKEVAGPCGTVISLAPGTWRATLRLDGVLDNPSTSRDVEVVAGKTAAVVVDFQTGVLEVRIEGNVGSGTGMVTVNRGRTRIGTLGAGVAARLSAGKYEVVVRYEGKERRYQVSLRPGQRRMLRAQF
ncbi:MAG: hypothetical protein WBG86_09185 [Polyangiales bacterium]